MPWEKGVAITPLPEPGKVAYMSELVADAVARSAHVVNAGGGAVAGTLSTRPWSTRWPRA